MSPDLIRWGIEPGYRDVRGEWHETPADTLGAVAGLMGVADGDPPGGGPTNPVRVVKAGEEVAVDGHYRLVLEDGTVLTGRGRLPPDLPLGYHELSIEPSQAGDPRVAPTLPVRLVVSPGRCHLPPDLRVWGWAVQLYALRSRSSWGMGDLADLGALARWADGLGAGLTLVNPLHAARPVPPQEASPYFPSSRCWRNPIYLRVEDVPGVEGMPSLADLAAAGRALGGDRLIDRDRVWGLKRQALEWAWDRFRTSRHLAETDAFEAWCRRAGPSLAGYATFAALSEVHEGPWPTWPEEVRHPEGPGVAAAAAALAHRVGYHQWLQWLVDGQLARAGGGAPLMSDLAIGVDPDGADAWWWQDCLALGARVGAPPDEFNTSGQDWGLPPLDPWRLRLARFEPFVQTVRAALAHAGGLRIDHVMGLFRLWWIPGGAAAADGTYVRYPSGEMLAILALESARAGAVVVGEDLGTVEPEMRASLAAADVLSYRLAWFEAEPPAAWPVGALAAVTTHDLPTVAGLWTGSDQAAQERLGLHGDPDANRGIAAKVAGWTGLGHDAPREQVIVALHRMLAGAPSAMVAATLDDALAVEERPNVPGTTAECRPNWCLALPATLEELMADPLVAEVAAALRRPPPGGPGGTDQPGGTDHPEGTGDGLAQM